MIPKAIIIGLLLFSFLGEATARVQPPAAKPSEAVSAILDAFRFSQVVAHSRRLAAAWHSWSGAVTN